ncbi:MAG: hypothetical protein ACFCVG_17515 [Kineosporiaceae bacterium]
MLIDCDTCRARPRACGDCVVSHLLAAPAAPVDLDEGAWAAVSVLSAAGLVPPLRLVPGSAAGPAAADDDSDVSSPDVTNFTLMSHDIPGGKRTDRSSRDIA